MTIKEVWKQFLNDVVDSGIKAWKDIRGIAKNTFDFFKDCVIEFVKGIFSWLWSLIEGVCGVIWELIKVVCSALMATIKSTLGIICEKIIAWIQRW